MKGYSFAARLRMARPAAIHFHSREMSAAQILGTWTLAGPYWNAGLSAKESPGAGGETA